VTSVSLKHFTYSLVGMLPTILLWVLVGSTSKSLAQKTIDDTSLQVYMGVLLGVGLWVAVLALFITWRIASKELRREIESNSAETWFRYRDDSQAASHPEDDDDESDDDDEEGVDDGATGTGTNTDESSGSHPVASVDPTALAALRHGHDAGMRAPPHSPENDRAASRLPRPPYHLSPLLPPDSPFSGVFGVLEAVAGDDDDEIIFLPDPGPSAAAGMYDEHDLGYNEEEPDGLHYDPHDDGYHHHHHQHYYDQQQQQQQQQQHPDHDDGIYYLQPSHVNYYPSHNWLLQQLGIGYGMDRHDPRGDPRGRDTDPLWLWA
jgi:hypothetical protein